MLENVDFGTQSIDCYEASAGREALDQLAALARPLRGVRVLHLNATPYGGGVAEILRSEAPLLRDLGLAADWKIITGDETFFRVTKAIHNGLQGAERSLTVEERETYLANATRNAKLLEKEYDLIVVHDPQPLALLDLRGKSREKWIWRCHVDTSEPNPEIWAFLRPFVAPYDAAVFTLGGFVPPDMPAVRVEVIPPAIDPESPKNIELDLNTARRILEWIGVDSHRPLVSQVSRFDPWKDPLGVIAAYKLMREERPELQLALVGSMALDDPEGWEIYHEIQGAARSDAGIHVFTNLTGVGNIEVNAFQRLSKVVIQKSIREGFGLVVSETLWKNTPVVAGRTGGIPLQMQGGAGGFLVSSVEECAERTLWLLRNAEKGKELAGQGKELVRERFLLTRLIGDELRLYASVLGEMRQPEQPVAQVALGEEARDPVCGMHVAPAKAIRSEHGGRAYYFCSAECRRTFHEDPGRFLRAAEDSR